MNLRQRAKAIEERPGLGCSGPRTQFLFFLFHLITYMNPVKLIVSFFFRRRPFIWMQYRFQFVNLEPNEAFDGDLITSPRIAVQQSGSHAR